MDDRAPESVDALELLRNRAEKLEGWLREHAPQVTEDQSHLDSGSDAQAYWNYGYLVALRDVLNSLDRGSAPLN